MNKNYVYGQSIKIHFIGVELDEVQNVLDRLHEDTKKLSSTGFLGGFPYLVELLDCKFDELMKKINHHPVIIDGVIVDIVPVMSISENDMTKADNFLERMEEFVDSLSPDESEDE